MLDWHETPEALGPPAAGPFRFSKEGTVHRREAQAVRMLTALTACALVVLSGFAAGGPPGPAVHSRM